MTISLTQLPYSRQAVLAFNMVLAIGCGDSRSMPRNISETQDLHPEDHQGAEGHSKTISCEQAPVYANEVVGVQLKPRALTNPDQAINGVYGGGRFAGSMDIFSLDDTENGEVVLTWKDRVICNQPGPDINVFENPFEYRGSDGVVFGEPVIVSVSFDGQSWATFPHDYMGRPQTDGTMDEHTNPGSGSATEWKGFAGFTPTLFHETDYGLSQGIDPLDRAQAGGDPFDLDNLEDSETAQRIKAQGFRYIRLQAAPNQPNPDTCMSSGTCLTYPNVPRNFNGGFADIDGVYAGAWRSL